MPQALVVVVLLFVMGCSNGDSPATTEASAILPPQTTEGPGATAPEVPLPTSATTAAAASEPTTTGTLSTTTLPPLEGLAYEAVANASFPIMMIARPGDSGALLAERGGIIRDMSAGQLGDVVLDLSGRTTVDSERGLLGLARHPDDDTRMFVHYTDSSGDTVVSEFSLQDTTADPDSEQVLLAVDQPAPNHNGGMIQFGPDGALYLGLGDGGGGGDRFGNGQNTETLLGGIVRIDVDSGAVELWQYGLRNPWRFWIDGNDIWIGDVGQRGFEEIDLADVSVPGLNYGWPITEGASCYNAADCDTSGLTMPLLQVPRGEQGTCAITGGLVYRGLALPELEGRFLFSDYCGGYLMSIDRDGEVEDHTPDVGVPGRVVSFGVDETGEAYVLTTDRVLRLVAVR